MPQAQLDWELFSSLELHQETAFAQASKLFHRVEDLFTGYRPPEDLRFDTAAMQALIQTLSSKEPLHLVVPMLLIPAATVATAAIRDELVLIATAVAQPSHSCRRPAPAVAQSSHSCRHSATAIAHPSRSCRHAATAIAHPSHICRHAATAAAQLSTR